MSILHADEPRPAWWAHGSEMVTAHCSLRVRCMVQHGTLGASFAVWVGARVVLAGWRPTKKRAWRAVTSCLDALNVGAELIEEIAP